MRQLREASIEALVQFSALLEILESSTEAEVYAESGIGKHLRHVLEHYQLLRQSLADDSEVINYNQRKRGTVLEQDATVARFVLDDLLHWLATATELNQDRPVSIISEVSCQSTVNAKIPSFLSRELHYLSYHSIHHVAYCSLLAQQEGIIVPTAIGLAPATASYLRTSGASAVEPIYK